MPQKTCLKCDHTADINPDREDCPNCGAIYRVVESLVAQGQPIFKIKSAEVQAAEKALAMQQEEQARHEQAELLRRQIVNAWATGNWSGLPESVFRQELAKVVVSTTDTLPDAQITSVVDLVTAECVYGLDLIDDYLMAISDLLGGRSKTAQNMLSSAKNLVIKELKSNAFKLGADAVVAARFSYSEISGKNKSMLLVALSGTAVKTNRSSVDRRE